jgi:hypothetical protein
VNLADARVLLKDIETETLALVRRWSRARDAARRDVAEELRDAARRLDRATQDVELLEDEGRRVSAIETRHAAP